MTLDFAKTNEKAGLAKKVANPKASRQPKPKSEGKMEVADVAEPTWITDPIMDTDAAPKSRQPASAIVAAHKQFMRCVFLPSSLFHPLFFVTNPILTSLYT